MDQVAQEDMGEDLEDTVDQACTVVDIESMPEHIIDLIWHQDITTTEV